VVDIIKVGHKELQYNINHLAQNNNQWNVVVSTADRLLVTQKGEIY
jgi:hypothetical protein